MVARASRTIAVACGLLCLALPPPTAEASRISLASSSGVASNLSYPPALTSFDRYWSIDVECIATGHGHNARGVAQIALVRGNGSVVLNLYVKPKVPVVSYMTPLTGVTAEILNKEGITIEKALETLRAHLPRNATIVGQSIHHDIRWLGLKEKVDFAQALDVGLLWQVWNPQYKSPSIFSQEHVAKVLLGQEIADGPHNAVSDAVTSMKLFKLYQEKFVEGERALEVQRQKLLSAPPTVSFGRRNPVLDGVCMGNRKMCVCGEPFW